MNNRQAGRRRGRGGQRQGGNPGRPDNGNRIDSRARGNAAQLLEKYKNLAQDAQRSGDRVTTEYYLQFADHYFRVLAESRSRFEEQGQGQGRRQQGDDGDEDGGEDFGFEGEAATPAQYQPRQSDQQDRDRPRRDRDRDEGREQRPRRERQANDDAGEDRARRPVNDEADASPREDRPVAANDEPRRRGRPRREAAPVAETEGFDAALLPPAISTEPAPAEEVVERPRRGRPRKVRNDDGEAVPPAA